MSSSSNASIAKKARTKAEADFATWLMMAKLGGFDDLPYEKFPVVGFVKDPTGVAALYLGKQEGKELVYMEKVGTGWSRTVSSSIRKQLDTVVSPKSKLTRPIKKPRPLGSPVQSGRLLLQNLGKAAIERKGRQR
jgi:hypothetical protein